ncbi:MAG: DUF1499 domain-containing protein [Maricaulaceae bacterium]
MSIVKGILAVVVLGCIVFFLLGLKSQKGVAKGLENGKLAECPASPNCVCSEADVQPEKLVAPLAATLAQAKAAIVKTGGVITSESDDYISATYMSGIFKYVDDVELRAEGDVVHIRSASRVGHSDMGANAKRVAAIRAAL